MYLWRRFLCVGCANQTKGQRGQGRRDRDDDDDDDDGRLSCRLPARYRDARPQFVDATALYCGDIPGHAVAHAAGRHATLRRPLLQAISVLGVRRGLSIVYFSEGAQSREPRRVWPVAMRRAQRRQPEARQEGV